MAVFRKSDPIVLGVDVEAGVLKIGTPLTIYNEKGQVNLSLFRKAISISNWELLNPSSTIIKN